MFKKTSALVLLFIVVLCTGKPTTTPPLAPVREMASDIADRLKKLPDTVIDYDHSLLNDQEKRMIAKLIEASRFIEEIYWRQVSEENPHLRSELLRMARNSIPHQLGLKYFNRNKGRWDRLVHNEPFIGPFGDAGKKPEGAGFYPPDMTKEEFEQWIVAHPKDKERFQSETTVIRREGDRLIAIPYSTYYREFLEAAAQKLREVAFLTDIPNETRGGVSFERLLRK